MLLLFHWKIIFTTGASQRIQETRQEVYHFVQHICAQNDALQPLSTYCINSRESLQSSMISVGCWFISQFTTLNLLYLVHDLVHIDAIAVSQLFKVAISTLKHNFSSYNHIVIIDLFCFFKELPESVYTGAISQNETIGLFSIAGGS